MTNHPSRNKPSRDALEMIAHFARHGIALEREQQEAAAIMCRAAGVVQRLEIERCNGDWHLYQVDQNEWRAEIDRRYSRAVVKIKEAARLFHCIEAVKIGGDVRGATVKLIMVPEWRRLHDSFGGDAYCVPGS